MQLIYITDCDSLYMKVLLHCGVIEEVRFLDGATSTCIVSI